MAEGKRPAGKEPPHPGGKDRGKEPATLWRRDEIESPCIAICLLHPDAGICIGCGRTGEEIARWSVLTAETRREIMAALPARLASLARRRGGRRRTASLGEGAPNEEVRKRD